MMLSYKCAQQLDQQILFENESSLEYRNFCTISSALWQLGKHQS